jgi:hypothetical protein
MTGSGLELGTLCLGEDLDDEEDDDDDDVDDDEDNVDNGGE